MERHAGQPSKQLGEQPDKQPRRDLVVPPTYSAFGNV